MTIDATFFQQPFHLGSLKVPNRVILSPLAGVSDVPFRRICTELGAGLTYVEMLSAVAINQRSERTFRMMSRHRDEAMLGVQVTGPSAASVAQAVETLDEEGFETIDINMGCPVKKITRKGAGSGILLEPERVSQTVEYCRHKTERPLSAKIRIGFTPDNIVVEDVSARIALAGADLLTIHGRTRADSYSVPNDYAAIRRGFDSVKDAVPVAPALMGNGDVMDFASACRMVEDTACDAVLVSRGALGNPWIFREILTGDAGHPTIHEWLDVVLRHLDYHVRHYGDNHLSVVAFRKHLLWYVSGFRGARPMRVELSTATALDQIRLRLKEFANSLAPSTRRFDTTQHVENEKTDAQYDPKYQMDRTHDRGVGDDGF